MWKEGNSSTSSRADVTFVLGMHRSGTSAIARAMKALGLDLGESHLPGVVNDNDRGYWEDVEVQNVCERALDHVGSRWNSLSPLSDADLRELCQTDIFIDATVRLKSMLGAGSPIAVKNPRLCKLAPFWTSVTHSLGVGTAFVIAVRNPLSVAHSLTRNGLRGDIPKFLGLKLWLSYLTGAVVSTKHYPRVFVDFDRMLSAPDTELTRIAGALGMPGPSIDGVRDYAEGFLLQELRHSQFSLDELQASPAIDEDVKRAYQLLLSAATAPGDHGHSSELQRFFERIGSKDSSAKRTLHFIDERESQLASLRSTVHNLGLKANSDERLLQAIDQSRAAAEARNSQIADDSNRLLTEATSAINDKVDRVASALDEAVAELDTRSEGLASSMASVEGQLSSLASIQSVDRLSEGLRLQLEQLASQLSGSLAQEVASASERVTAAMQSHEQLMDRMRVSHEQLIEQLQQRADGELTLVRQQMADAARHHEQAVQQLRAEQAEHLAQADARLAAAQQDHGQTLESLRHEHSLILALERERSAELLRQTEAGAIELRQLAADMQTRLADVVHQHGQAVDQLRREHAQALESERQRSADLLQQAELAAGELRQASVQGQAALVDAVQRHEQAVERLQAAHAQALEHERQRSVELLGQAAAQADTQHQQAVEKLAELDRRHQLRMEAIRAEHAQALAHERQHWAELLHRADNDAIELRRASAEQLAERDAALARAQEDFGQRLATANRQFDATLLSMEARLREQQAAFDARLRDHKEQTAQLSAAHVLSEQALRQQHAEVIKAHDAAMHDQAVLHAQQIRQLAQAHASELASVKEMAAAEARRIGEDRDQRIHELQAQAERARNRDRATIMELEQTLQTMRGWRGMGLITWWNGKGQPPAA